MDGIIEVINLNHIEFPNIKSFVDKAVLKALSDYK